MAAHLPDVHTPVQHSAPSAHAAPCGLQKLAPHTPFTQFALQQSESLLQLVPGSRQKTELRQSP